MVNLSIKIERLSITFVHERKPFYICSVKKEIFHLKEDETLSK